MTGAQLQEFSGMMRAVFLRSWWFDGDADDVAQDAAEAVLRAARKKRLPLKGHRSYYFPAALCEARLGFNRAKAALTMGERALKNASRYADRTPLAGCGPSDERAVHILDYRYPDGDLRRRDAAAARAQLLGVLEDHAETLKPTERQVVAMLLGLGGQLRQMDPEEVYEATGLAAASVWAIVRRFGKQVRRDKGAVRARRAYLSQQEAA